MHTTELPRSLFFTCISSQIVDVVDHRKVLMHGYCGSEAPISIVAMESLKSHQITAVPR